MEFVDLFTYYNGTNNNNITVGMGYINDRLICFEPSEDGNYKMSFCQNLGITGPNKKIYKKLTGVEKIKSQDYDYTIFSYQDGDHDNLLLIDENTKLKTVHETEWKFLAIANLGLGRDGRVIIDAITDKGISIMYAVDLAKSKGNVEVRLEIVDKRLSDHYNGCPSKMCLEGGIDSMLNTYFEDEINTKLFLIKKNHAYILTPKNNNQSNYNTLTTFGEYVYYKECPGSIFLIFPPVKSDDPNAKRKYQEACLDNWNWFASIQINLTHYYFFKNDEKSISPSEALDYINGTGFELFHFIDTLAKYRFYRLWKRFDAAYKDPNDKYVYFFNQDYNVRYEWKDTGLMTPVEEPRLNQKTFWNCENTDLYNGLLSHAFGYKTLDEYYENVPRKLRYVPLENDYDIPKETLEPDQTSNKTPKKPFDWLIVIIVAVIAGVLSVALGIYCAFKKKWKRRSTNSDAPEPKPFALKRARKKDSFTSLSTVGSKLGSKESKPRKKESKTQSKKK